MNRDDRMGAIPWKTSLCLLLFVVAILAGCEAGTSASGGGAAAATVSTR